MFEIFVADVNFMKDDFEAFSSIIKSAISRTGLTEGNWPPQVKTFFLMLGDNTWPGGHASNSMLV